MQDAIIFAASTASSAVFILENEIRIELLASSAVRPIAVSTWLGSASWLRQAEPAEIQTDANGFPANPEVNQTFVDSTGTEYIYNGIFGWIQDNDGNPDVQKFPDNYEGGIFGGGQSVLH